MSITTERSTSRGRGFVRGSLLLTSPFGRLLMIASLGLPCSNPQAVAAQETFVLRPEIPLNLLVDPKIIRTLGAETPSLRAIPTW